VSFYLHAFPAWVKVSVPLFGRRFRSRSKIVAGFASYGDASGETLCSAHTPDKAQPKRHQTRFVYIKQILTLRFWLAMFHPPKARVAMHMQAFLAAQRR
jgi:hypothetical protein